MKYLFFHAVNALSKDGKLKPRHSVWFEALVLLTMGTVLWIMTVVVSYYHIAGEFFTFTKTPIYSLSLIIFGALYYFLIKDKKHQLIIEENKNETPEKNRTGKILTALYIFTPIFLVLLMALIVKHRI